MATNALIACLKGKLFEGITVHSDGYIEGGVGETLLTHWDKLKDIKKLCNASKSIRNFGMDFNNIEYYPYSWEDAKYASQFKDMDWNSLCNMAGNFNYTYVWYLGRWYLLKNNNYFKPLKTLI
jgi:hypothetical protein